MVGLETASGSLSAELSESLAKEKLSFLESRLLDIGVACAGDLNFLEEADLDNWNFNLIQRRRFQAWRSKLLEVRSRTDASQPDVFDEGPWMVIEPFLPRHGKFSSGDIPVLTGWRIKLMVTIEGDHAFALQIQIYFGVPAAGLKFSGDLESYPNNKFQMEGNNIIIDPSSDCLVELPKFKQRGGGGILYESSKIEIGNVVFLDADTICIKFEYIKEKLPREDAQVHVAHLMRQKQSQPKKTSYLRKTTSSLFKRS